MKNVYNIILMRIEYGSTVQMVQTQKTASTFTILMR